MAEEFPTVIRLTRPTAVDVREWKQTTMDALNELGVAVGEDFEIARAPGQGKPRPSLTRKKVKTQDAAQTELAEEPLDDEPEQGELI